MLALNYMKSIKLTTLAIFIVVLALVIASNTINWDETILEHSHAALPLGLGLLLELPWLFVGSVLTGNGSDQGLISYAWYPTMIRAIPFLTGMLYSGLFYFIATRLRQWSLNNQQAKLKLANASDLDKLR